MNEQPYDSEKLLQSWLAKYPALLVRNQIDAKEPRRWLFIEQKCAVPSEEGGSGRWAIDNLFLDQDAVPTIVGEAKPKYKVLCMGAKAGRCAHEGAAWYLKLSSVGLKDCNE